MKNLTKLFILLISVAFVPKVAHAQIDFDTFLEAGVQDANTLLRKYMEPAFVGFGFGMNSGWYNTAKPHKTLGFDLTFSASLAVVPSAQEFFTFVNSEYQNVRLSDPADNRLPTLFGPNLGADDLPGLTFLDPGTGLEIIRISAPTGLGIDEDMPFNAVPTPTVQLGVGLPKGTEVKIRLLPKVNFGDEEDGEGSVKLFGLGVMHDVKQWIPGIKALPLEISGFIGFTSLTSSFDVDEDNPDQVAEFKANAFTLQVLASKNIAFVTGYLGIGYKKSDVDFDLKGTYTTELSTYTNPIAFNYSNSGLGLNIGLRLKLLFLTLHGEYAIQEYNTVTAGLGFSFR